MQQELTEEKRSFNPPAAVRHAAAGGRRRRREVFYKMRLSSEKINRSKKEKEKRLNNCNIFDALTGNFTKWNPEVNLLRRCSFMKRR